MIHERDLLDRVGGWADACTSTLRPLVGASAAWNLIESALSESIGGHLDRRMDAADPGPGTEKPAILEGAPSQSELMEFLERFWGVVALTRERPVLSYANLSVDRLRELQNSVCANIVSEFPTTLGRFGREIFTRDWRNILERLPEHAEARAHLVRVEGGKEVYAQCLQRLNEFLAPGIADADGSQELLRFRSLARERLETMRPRPKAH